MREGRAEDHRGAPDSDEERGHTLADSSRAVVRGRGRGRWKSVRKGRQWAQHGFNNKNSGGCRFGGLFWPRSEWGGGGGAGGRGRWAGERERNSSSRGGAHFASQTDTSPFLNISRHAAATSQLPVTAQTLHPTPPPPPFQTASSGVPPQLPCGPAAELRADHSAAPARRLSACVRCERAF